MKAEMMKSYDTDGDGKLSDEERAKMPKVRPRGPGGPDGKRPERPKAPPAAEGEIVE